MAGETTLTMIGSLTADPELRYTQIGDAVANFTVASNARFFDKTANEWKDGDALFMRCSIWRDAAEHVTDSLVKGARVIVVGRLKQRSFEKDGVKRTVMELDVDEVGPSLKWATAKILKAARSGEGGGYGSSGATVEDPWAQAPKTAATVTGGGYDDEPPF